MINYVWSVNALYTIQQPQPDYVVCALWTLTGSDEQHNANVQGSTQFSITPDSPSFVPYDELTQEIVVQWIQSSLGVTSVVMYEEQLAEQLTSYNNPQATPQKTPLPWGN
jgi:hypothetical protein